MIMGIVFFGYIIASVAASMANADAQRARYQEKIKAINVFMKVGMQGFVFFSEKLKCQCRRCISTLTHQVLSKNE